ncbi:hypothetical protein NA56DRAFT_350007 [Hyaloscypha hepaticicola]|jgi:hypothetical protein|uniref:Uncharacterized protein n=1 Tax=Hyaloscypha hepaticicola TaxID=2082293 RepID=A0A2J6PMM8_9HELO|nr:hypothetical protein NA56DRAFT_350007 [Hyaloscypha hepaticicola]
MKKYEAMKKSADVHSLPMEPGYSAMRLTTSYQSKRIYKKDFAGKFCAVWLILTPSALCKNVFVLRGVFCSAKEA